MAVDITVFRATFPSYSNTTEYPDAMITAKNVAADCHLTSPEDLFGATCAPYAEMLMVAHLLFIGDLVKNGQTHKQISTATEGNVNVSLEAIPALSAWGYWLSTSPYGLELNSLIQTQAAIGAYALENNEADAYPGIRGFICP